MLGVVKEIFDSNQQVAVVLTCAILFPSIRRVHGCCDHCTLSLPRAPRAASTMPRERLADSTVQRLSQVPNQ